MVRGIRPSIEGLELAGVYKCRCQCKPILIEPTLRRIQRQTRGQRVVTIYRLAKRVVIELSSGDSFVIEPRMTGMMLLSDPPNPAYLRLEWRLRGNGTNRSLWFWDRRGLGTVRLLSKSEMASVLGPSRLGPDALAMTLDEWKSRCAKTGREIKVALLDQKLVAGIGNLYASEILHLAKIDPTARSNELKPRQLRRLHASTAEILNSAIRYEGSTLNDGTYRNALNKTGSYQNSHRVYNRADEICPTCHKAPIQRIVQAQRSTFFCPHCQRV